MLQSQCIRKLDYGKLLLTPAVGVTRVKVPLKGTSEGVRRLHPDKQTLTKRLWANVRHEYEAGVHPDDVFLVNEVL